MARAESRKQVRSSALTNTEAAALINIILNNTDTSVPRKPVVPDSPKSLTDYFPVAVLGAV